MLRRIVLVFSLLALIPAPAGCGEESNSGKSDTAGTNASTTTTTAPSPATSAAAAATPAPATSAAPAQVDFSGGEESQNTSLPHVVKTSPENKNAAVDPATADTIEFDFSADMLQSAYNPQPVEGYEYPDIVSQNFVKPTRFVMKIQNLKPETKYAVGLNQKDDKTFVSSAGHTAAAPFVLKFKTGKDYSRILGWNELETKALRGDEVYLNQLMREGNVITTKQKINIVSSSTTTVDPTEAGAVPPTTSVQTMIVDETHTDTITEIRDFNFREGKREFGDVVLTATAGAPGGLQSGGPQLLPQSNHEYIIRHKGSEWHVLYKGKEDPDSVGTVLEWPSAPTAILPSDRIMTIGKVWTAEAPWLDTLLAYIKGMNELEDSKCLMRVSKVYAEGGDKIARIAIKWTITAKILLAPEQTVPFTYNIKGHALFNLTKRRLTSVHMEGAGSCKADVQGVGLVPTMHKAIEGNLSIDASWDYELWQSASAHI